MIFVYALEDTAETLGSVCRVSFPIFLGLMGIACLLTFNRQNCSFAIWYFLTYVQFIRWVPLVNTDQPDSYKSFFKQVAKSMNEFEIIPITDSETPEGNFNSIGVVTHEFLSNAEESLLFIIVCLIVYCYLCKKKVLLAEAKFSLLIRSAMIVYMDIMLFSVLQLKEMDFSSFYKALNSMMALIFIIGGTIFMILVPISTKRAFEKYESTGRSIHLQEIRTLVEEFSGDSSHQFYTVFLILRFVSALVFALLAASPVMQVFTIGIAQLMVIIYVIGAQPFKLEYENFIVALAEMCVILLIVLTGLVGIEGVSDDWKDLFSYCCVGAVYVGEVMCIARFLAIIKEREKLKTPKIPPNISLQVHDSTSRIHTFNGKEINVSLNESQLDMQVVSPVNIFNKAKNQELQFRNTFHEGEASELKDRSGNTSIQISDFPPNHEARKEQDTVYREMDRSHTHYKEIVTFSEYSSFPLNNVSDSEMLNKEDEKDIEYDRYRKLNESEFNANSQISVDKFALKDQENNSDREIEQNFEEDGSNIREQNMMKEFEDKKIENEQMDRKELNNLTEGLPNSEISDVKHDKKSQEKEDGKYLENDDMRYLKKEDGKYSDEEDMRYIKKEDEKYSNEEDMRYMKKEKRKQFNRENDKHSMPIERSERFLPKSKEPNLKEEIKKISDGKMNSEISSNLEQKSGFENNRNFAYQIDLASVKKSESQDSLEEKMSSCKDHVTIQNQDSKEEDQEIDVEFNLKENNQPANEMDKFENTEGNIFDKSNEKDNEHALINDDKLQSPNDKLLPSMNSKYKQSENDIKLNQSKNIRAKKAISGNDSEKIEHSSDKEISPDENLEEPRFIEEIFTIDKDPAIHEQTEKGLSADEPEEKYSGIEKATNEDESKIDHIFKTENDFSSDHEISIYKIAQENNPDQGIIPGIHNLTLYKENKQNSPHSDKESKDQTKYNSITVEQEQKRIFVGSEDSNFPIRTNSTTNKNQSEKSNSEDCIANEIPNKESIKIKDISKDYKSNHQNKIGLEEYIEENPDQDEIGEEIISSDNDSIPGNMSQKQENLNTLRSIAPAHSKHTKQNLEVPEQLEEDNQRIQQFSNPSSYQNSQAKDPNYIYENIANKSPDSDISYYKSDEKYEKNKQPSNAQIVFNFQLPQRKEAKKGEPEQDTIFKKLALKSRK